MVSVERAWRSFGFEARVELEDGLRRTVDWYLANLANTGEAPPPLVLRQ